MYKKIQLYTNVYQVKLTEDKLKPTPDKCWNKAQ